MEYKDVLEWLVFCFRNLLGLCLLMMSVFEFLFYIGVMFDLDVKIMLLNVVVEVCWNVVYFG